MDAELEQPAYDAEEEKAVEDSIDAFWDEFHGLDENSERGKPLDGPRPDEIREALRRYETEPPLDANDSQTVLAAARAYLSILDDPIQWLREQGAVNVVRRIVAGNLVEALREDR